MIISEFISLYYIIYTFGDSILLSIDLNLFISLDSLFVFYFFKKYYNDYEKFFKFYDLFFYYYYYYWEISILLY